jgi:spermidine synthase
VSLFAKEVCLYDASTATGRVQVFERGDRMELRFGNGIVQSARSKSAPNMLLLEYTRALLTCLLLVSDAPHVLHLGLGAGTIPDFIHRHLPASKQRVVEVSEEVIAVAERYFELPRSVRLQVVQDDGINHLRVTRDRFDLIVFDAFLADGAARQMTTTTAFDLAKSRLNPGGWIVNNAWGSDSLLLRTMLLALKERFDEVHSLSVRLNSNVILLAGSPEARTTLTELRRKAELLSRKVPLDFEPWLKQFALPTPFRKGMPVA